MNSTHLSEQKLCQLYELDQCVKWIEQNNFSSVALQFSRNTLQFSSSIVLYLKKTTKSEYYVSVSTMCCVDYLTIKHLNDSTVDSIIYFGNVCLTSSPFVDSLPVLYVFGNDCDNESIHFIESSIKDIESNNTLILYNTSNTYMAIELTKKLNENNELNRKVCLAKLNVISEKWNFTNSVSSVIKSDNSQPNETSSIFGPFLISDDIKNYDLVVHLGKCNSLHSILSCNNLLEIDIITKEKQLISSSKELRKRVAKIEKFKQKSCALIGIIFTNPLPDVDNLCAQSKQLAKKLKKKVYFISLVQTLDEYKLGNFAQLEGFVIANSCWCSTVLNSLNYCHPILNWTEFEIAAGLQRNYGNVDWNNETEDVSCSDSEESELNPDSGQLIETKIFDQNKWFGLQVDAGSKEASIVKSGQRGVASFYENEDHF